MNWCHRASAVLASHLVVSLLLTGCAGPSRGAAGSVNSAGPSAPALVRCVVLVPVRLNDGADVPAVTLRQVEERLFARFDGYTLAGTVHGAYRMADGSRADDESREYWIALEPRRVPELRREVARVGALLEQESMYFETAGAVEFVRSNARRE